MATAPTFVTSYSSSYTTATSPKTVSVTTLPGDVVVVYGGSEDSGIALSTPVGNAVTFTLNQSVITTNFATTYIWTGVDINGGTNWTLSVSSSGGGNWGFSCLVFRNSDGAGASNQSNSASGVPSVSLTTVQDNSAVVIFDADWNAQDNTGRTWTTVNGITPTSGNGMERDSVYQSGTWSAHGAYYNDVGLASSKSPGMSAPAGQTWSLVAVEIKGNTAPVVRSSTSGATTGGSGGTLSVTTDSSTAVGDTMVAFMAQDDGSASQMPTTGSWTSQGKVYSTANNLVCLEVFTMRVATAGATTYQHPDTTGSDKAMSIVVIAGSVSPDSITFTPTSGNTTGSGGSYTNLAGTTTRSDELILVSWLRDYATGSPTAGLGLPSGMTNRTANTNTYLDLLVGSKTQIVAGSTGTFTATDATSTSSYVGAVLAIKPAGLPMSTFVDSFTSPTVNTNLWFVSTSTGSATQTNNQLLLSPASNNPGYDGFVSINLYDLTSSSVTIEIVQGCAPTTGVEQGISLQIDNSNRIVMFISTGIAYRLTTAGVDDSTYDTRNDVAMRWWRIRESKGTIYWETSPDGSSWTTRTTKTATFSITNLTVYAFAGTWQNVASPGTGIFDNLNTLGSTPVSWWVA